MAALWPHAFQRIQGEEYRLAVQQFLSTMAELQEVEIEQPGRDIYEMDENELEDGCGELLFMYPTLWLASYHPQLIARFRNLAVGSPINVLVLYAWLYAPTSKCQKCHLFRQKYDGDGIFDSFVNECLENLIKRFGANDCLSQAQTMIKDDDMLDDMLWEALHVISGIIEKWPVAKLFGFEIDLADAVKRQIEFGDAERTWAIGAMASGILE
jgi:hypothetical protein